MTLMPLFRFQLLAVWAAHHDGEIYKMPSWLTGLLLRIPMELSCDIILHSQAMLATLLLLQRV